jgi:hypothetical protein
MQIPSYDFRINGLNANDILYNIYAFRQDMQRWSKKVARARKDHTRQVYKDKMILAANQVAANERRLNRLNILNTLAHLQHCRAARAAGHQVSYTTDPAWLVEQAINRRAGWPDDPSCTRGSCMPVQGRYPKKASGDTYHHLHRLSRAINTPRLIVHVGELGAWRTRLLARLPERFDA